MSVPFRVTLPHTARAHPLAAALFILVALLIACDLAAQDPAPSIQLPLEPRALAEPVARFSLSFQPQTTPFQKEPAVSASNVQRGSFNVHGSQTTVVRYLWDISKRELYLDLNNNGDLTDDTNSPVRTAQMSGNQGVASFDGVRLQLPVNGHIQPVLCDLTLYNFGTLNGQLAVRSYWSAKLSLHQQDWELGVIPTLTQQLLQPGTQLLLRSWAEHDQPFARSGNNLVTFSCSSNVFLAGQAFNLQHLPPSADSPHPQILLTPQYPPLGTLNLAGHHLGRVILHDGPWTLVLDRPSPDSKVPAGTYRTHLVEVRQGDTRTVLQNTWSGSQTPVTITTNQTATLAVGGPLTNTVTVQQRGAYLALNYSLVGAGGEVYQPLSRPRTEAPRFKIFSGTREIESGAFEFG